MTNQFWPMTSSAVQHLAFVFKNRCICVSNSSMLKYKVFQTNLFMSVEGFGESS